MKLLAYSDLQAGLGSERMFADPTVSLQQYRVIKFYKDLHAHAKRLKADGIICAGDCTDDRSSIPIPTLDAVIEGISRFKGMTNFKVVGNHEQFVKNTSMHAGKLFESVFEVFSDPQERVVTNGTRFSFVFAPFPPPGKEGAFKQKVRDLVAKARGEKREVILIGHFPVIGSAICGGKMAKGIDSSIFQGISLGLLGDIHRPQKINEKPPVWYIGSPFQQDFGEAGEAKRIALLDTEERSVNWIEMTGFPQYRCLPWSEFKEVAKADSEDRYRVSLKSSAETEAFYAHPLSHRAEPEYNYEEVQVEAEKTSKRSDWSLQASLRRYASAVNPSAKGIEMDADELVSVGEELATHS